MMLKFFFPLFLFSLALPTLAGPFPAGVLDLDSLIFETRGQLERKIQGLFENYISNTNRSRTVFTSSEAVACAHRMIPKGQALAVIEYHHELKFDELIERMSYTDCFGSNNLHEIVITKGNNLRPLTLTEWRSGRRSFELAKNEIEKRYVLTDEKNEELISLMTYRQDINLRASIRLRGKRFLDLAREIEDERERYIFTLNSIDIDYRRSNANWGWHMRMPVTTYSALRLKSDSNDITHYLNTNNQPISMQAFQTELGRFGIESLKLVGQFVEYHLYTFPSTDFSRSSVQKNRFLEELNLAYIQLLNNTDLNLVTNFIRNIIDAMAQGLIRVEDRRPKED